MLTRPGLCTPSRALARGRGGLRLSVLTLFVSTVAAWSVACSSDGPTSVDGVDIVAAKGGSSGGGGGKPGGGGGPSGDPTVTSTNPPSAPRDTTLDVRVLGTGFDDGSVARFLLNGSSVPDVRTNSTRFVTSKELVANITIAADAVTDFYDVEVTTFRGKRGVGIELFEVTATPIELAGLSRRGETKATAINDAGVIVGWSEDRTGTPRAVRWLPQGGGWGDPEPLAAGPSGAYAINEAGFVAGIVGDYPGTLVVWRPDGSQVDLGPGRWGGTLDINANGTVVGALSNSGEWLAYRYDPSRGEWRAEVIATYANAINGISDGEVAFGPIATAGGMELAATWTYANGAWNGPNVMSHAGAVGGWARDGTAAGVAGGLWVQGSCDAASVHQTAAYWPSGKADPIPIPGLESPRSWSYDINANGVVVGERYSQCVGSARAFAWSSSTGVRLLAPLRGDGASAAYALNDAGQVVGESRGGFSGRPVVWVLP